MGKYNISEILQLVEIKDLLIAPEKFLGTQFPELTYPKGPRTKRKTNGQGGISRIRNVEGGRKKRSPVKVGFLLLQTGFNFWLFRDRGAGPALDNFCQHVDHRRPVFDNQGVGRFIGYDAAFW